MLELIDTGCGSQRRSRPIVFVHGAWQASWCWQEHFVAYFAASGFRVLAPSLRGHGRSPSSTSLRFCSIADYVIDVCEVVDALPEPPIVIGHSIGGFVVQKYLESHDSPAAVLMASTPPRGGQLGSVMRMMRRHPLRSTKFAISAQPSDLVGTPEGARDLFFGDDAPDGLVDSFMQRTQPDSTRAIMFDTIVGDLVATRKIRTPMLVIGGERDQIYGPKHVRRTAQLYGTEPVLIPGGGHEMMLDPQWMLVARSIESWLTSQGL